MLAFSSIYSWSCLDYASTGGLCLIQSVGSLYQGTAIANLAMLGEVLGVSCPYVNDLLESGAVTWLATIPTEDRQKVFYYTTMFTDRAWYYDYCHVGTDTFLTK